jgi:esterase/lipase superfamily enzyme
VSQYDALHEAIARIWDELPELFGALWEATDLAMLPLLRSLDGDEHDEAEDEIYELFRPVPQALERLNRVLSELIAHPVRGDATAAGEIPRRRQHERYVSMPVLYATDRAPDTSRDGSTHYTGTRGDRLRTGLAIVTIPDDHRMGKLERPRIWRCEFRENPARHVIVLEVNELASDRFVETARAMVETAGTPESLIFIHGFRVDFLTALRRTAQVAYDLAFAGVPMLYSWPSPAKVLRYVTDEATIRWTEAHFREFVELTATQLELEVVHIVAHSMGNRVLAETLGSTPGLGAAQAGARLDQIVFAAPDIDSDTFRQLATQFTGRAGRVTLYSSSKDVALETSHKVHGYPRAGDSGEGLVVVAGVDTIDVTAVDTSLMGHSYYGDNRSVLSDLFAVIHGGRSPSERFGLIQRSIAPGDYWEFRP